MVLEITHIYASPLAVVYGTHGIDYIYIRTFHALGIRPTLAKELVQGLLALDVLLRLAAYVWELGIVQALQVVRLFLGPRLGVLVLRTGRDLKGGAAINLLPSGLIFGAVTAAIEGVVPVIQLVVVGLVSYVELVDIVHEVLLLRSSIPKIQGIKGPDLARI